MDPLQARVLLARAGRLAFFSQHQHLVEVGAFDAYLAPLRRIDWVVYAKRPFSGPAAVLAYLSRYTHRVAISNSRLIAHDGHGVTFKCKDYRAKPSKRYKTMRLATDEFIRRFLIHVLPPRFHRIRHFGLFTNHLRERTLRRILTLLREDTADNSEHTPATVDPNNTPHHTYVCPACGAPMIVIELIEPAHRPRAPPS